MNEYKNSKNMEIPFIHRSELPSLDEIDEKHYQFIGSLWSKDPEKRPTFDWIIDNLLHNKYECWLKNFNIRKNSIEQAEKDSSKIEEAFKSNKENKKIFNM